jgi:HlyD family secretion protein
MDAAEAAYLNAKSDLVSSEASLAQAKSTLDLSKVDLGYSVIRAPVDGVVITRKVNIGQTLQSSYAAPVLFQVATDLTKMKVECSVDESDIGKVKESQKVRFTVEAYPNETFNGVVQQVRFSPETVQNVVTYTTIVNVDNPEKKLLPGMTATVSIIVGEAKNVLRVSNAALRFTPSLSQEELGAIMKESMERMMAQRQAQGGQPGAPAGSPAEGGARPEGGQAGQRQFNRQGGGIPAGGEGQAGRTRQQLPRVWMQDKDGKWSMMFVRTGVQDTSYSEIVRSELKEGDVIVTGQLTASTMTSTGNPGMGGMMFMGGPPSGGRR